MYILVALGFAFLFNMLGVLNLAHGAIYMVSGYIGYVFVVTLGLNHWLALAVTTLIVAFLGVFLERFCFRPFKGDFNRITMVGVAITVILQTAVNILAGTRNLVIPSFAEGVFSVGRFSVSHERVVTFAIGAVLLCAIVWFVSKTRHGQQMQAIAENVIGASLQGIDVHRMSAIASGLACGLAAVAGCMMGAYLGLGPFIGDFMLVKTLMLVILAGVGTIGGIFISGLVLGTLNSILPVLMSGSQSDAITVCIVVALLFLKPKGFFGHEA